MVCCIAVYEEHLGFDLSRESFEAALVCTIVSSAERDSHTPPKSPKAIADPGMLTVVPKSR